MKQEILNVRRQGEFYYPIYFENSFQALAEAVEAEGLSGRSVCIVTDSHVAPLYAEEAAAALRKTAADVSVFVFQAGEPSKNLDTVQSLYQFLIHHKMDRKGVLAALGGGVTGDLTGFAAATYLRGIDFIQIPTTLLAQVDSSVGGKTGVDFQQYKNMVGAFHQPRLVYMNLETLKSLPEQEFACGMGEVLKTGLICDGVFFRRVAGAQQKIRSLDTETMAWMIRRCCEIKAGVVERDPKEQGERALLNLGHTVGHAVEKLMDFRLLHGQCVAVGMAAAAAISQKRGLLTQQEVQEILDACRAYGLPVTAEGLDAGGILKATKNDKKMEQGQIKFILMDGIGRSQVDRTVTDQELLEGIRRILQ